MPDEAQNLQSGQNQASAAAKVAPQSDPVEPTQSPAADPNKAPDWLNPKDKKNESSIDKSEAHSQALSEINREFEEKSVVQKSEQLGLPYVYISKTPINLDLLSLIDYDKAKEALALPFFKVGKKLRVAVADPNNQKTKTLLKTLEDAGYEVSLHLASGAGMNEALNIYDKRKFAAPKEVVKNVDEAKIQAYEKEIAALKDVKEKLNAVSSEEGLNMIDVGAIKTGASDVHYEPGEHKIAVRFRIDGILHQVFELDREAFLNIANQIKYKSKLKLNITNVPQDGRYSFTINERDIDVRVSTLPTQFGETFVCRYLDSKQGFSEFEDLGFEGDHLKQLTGLTTLSNGMILVTGPTGSGKTTTLYSMLNFFNTPEKKTITLEDPIEYHIPGVSQSQVNEKRNYTFASGLRSILRQDPDIVMLGEIRDLETAETATQAALTGHVLLATLHTNSAIESIPRLVNMGLPPFMVAPSVHSIIGQRLVRKVCNDCHTMESPSASEREDMQTSLESIKSVRKDVTVEIPEQLPKVVGCEKCSHTGYKGRSVICEILRVDNEIKDMILNKESSVKIIESARKKGMITMREDGILKVIAGVTTLDEVYRATNMGI